MTRKKDTFDPKRHPTLYRLLKEKVIWIEEDEYVGKAADGTIVGLGRTDFNVDGTEAYLRDHPTRWDW